uniref:(northern house mosquito) hypothetical protein n=1 Tax=Culex pipiens TaxID=7175 RepID=A0A8D8GQ57_CULPI
MLRSRITTYFNLSSSSAQHCCRMWQLSTLSVSQPEVTNRFSCVKFMKIAPRTSGPSSMYFRWISHRLGTIVTSVTSMCRAVSFAVVLWDVNLRYLRLVRALGWSV